VKHKTRFEDLTKLQRRVVKWCYDNEKSPRDAVKAGMVTKQTLGNWTIPVFHHWTELYRATLPTELDLLRLQLRAMTRPALRVIADTLNAGQGDAVAVRTAQWILDGAVAQLEAERAAAERDQVDDGDEELANVLRMIL
jgi:hypothetical protein